MLSERLRRAVLLLLPVLASFPVPARGEAPDRIEVTIPNVRNASGQVLCALHSTAATFPGGDAAFRRTRADIVGHRARCVFDDVPRGRYAVSVFHDENGNFKLDTNFLGIPREGVGVSNDARGFRGPPRFKEALFDYPGHVLSLTIHLNYL